MIKIVESTNRDEVRALLKPTAIRDRATERTAARIVARVRTEGRYPFLLSAALWWVVPPWAPPGCA